MGRRVRVVERGAGTSILFLHSGVGGVGEWRQVFSLWPEGYRLLAIDAHAGGGPGPSRGRSLADYADQVYAVAEHVGAPLRLVGFSWGGAAALHAAATEPGLVDSLAVIEPEAYGLLRTQDDDAYALIAGLRDRWRTRARAGAWNAAFEEFIDFYNGPGSFARWPAERRQEFVAVQRSRGDLWDILFDEQRLGLHALAEITAPTNVIEGSQTSTVDHAICTILRRHLPQVEHTLIEGAGHMMPLTHPRQLARELLTRIAE
ncbi:MAG TPA: alpha/beta hydrolase [Gaiellaceae bacterium]|nr:alpha/beta hydrolase [Gaiellaceae bacterium]